MAAMKRFVKDTELVWHAVGTLNGLHAKSPCVESDPFVEHCPRC
jgi:hypothetical protein